VTWAPVAPRAAPARSFSGGAGSAEAEFYRPLDSSGVVHPLGVGLESVCSGAASPRRFERRQVWSFEDSPEISYVDPDGPAGKAGLRPGDTLTHVDGKPITSDEGGRRFGAVKPNESVRWTYERDGKTFIASLTAGEHPDRAFLVDPDVSEDLQRSLAELRAEQARMREERRKSFADRTTRSTGGLTHVRGSAALERSSRSAAEVVVPETPNPRAPGTAAPVRGSSRLGSSPRLNRHVHGTSMATDGHHDPRRHDPHPPEEVGVGGPRLH
jgi:hypothetical protein